MPTVYPTPLPESMLHDAAHEAERRVYDALARLLSPDHAVFYSVAWLTRAAGHAARAGRRTSSSPTRNSASSSSR